MIYDSDSERRSEFGATRSFNRAKVHYFSENRNVYTMNTIIINNFIHKHKLCNKRDKLKIIQTAKRKQTNQQHHQLLMLI